VTIRRREGSRSPVHIHLEDTAPVHVHVQKPKKPHFTAFDVRKLRRVINETSDQSGLGYKQRFYELNANLNKLFEKFHAISTIGKDSACVNRNKMILQYNIILLKKMSRRNLNTVK